MNLFKGMSKSKAYKEAGYAPSSGAASTLSKQPDIAARLEDLRQEQEQARKNRPDNSNTQFDEDWFCQRLEDLAQAAEEAGKYKDAISAISEIRSIKGIGADQKTGSNNGNKENNPALPPPGQVNIQVLIDATKQSGDGVTVLPANLRDVTPGLPQMVDQTDGDGGTTEPADSSGSSESVIGSAISGEAKTSST